MFMVQMNLSVLEDVNRDKALRDWVYIHYGTAGRASYTMFEATFSAKWATHLARPLIEDVSPWFSLFWILYTVVVNFAIIRIIAALFLKQTMAVAAIDAERMAMENMKAKEKILATIREIFNLGDTSSDGTIDRSEFRRMMENPQVLKLFENLELEFNEVWMLFELLCEDDGVADAEEFISGCMRLKTNAKTVDMIHLMHQQVVTKRSVDTLTRGVEQINTVLHSRTGAGARTSRM
uniref:EF-hand domain-containing protein n=1 Tax=Alexandrium monilatum TaxID=311494 RepID=A0A7S4QYN5_9DINO